MPIRNRSLSHTKRVHFHRPKIPTICYLVQSFVLVGGLNFNLRLGLAYHILSFQVLYSNKKSRNPLNQPLKSKVLFDLSPRIFYGAVEIPRNVFLFKSNV